jgi:hypothetical protein
LGTTVSFDPGAATATLVVTPIDDTELEVPESVIVSLVGGAGYRPGTTASATVTIRDDDADVTVTATDATAGEPKTGEGNGRFTFTRVGSTSGSLTIHFSVSGSAAIGADYTSIGTTVTFSAGSATATKTINVLDDLLVEGDETVVVTVEPGSNYGVTNPSSAQVIIKDNIGQTAESGTWSIDLDEPVQEAPSWKFFRLQPLDSIRDNPIAGPFWAQDEEPVEPFSEPSYRPRN